MFSLVALVILGCLSKEAWSCSCAPQSHPQTVFCNSPVVFRAKFMGQTDYAEREQWSEFQVKTTKIFKGPEELDDIQVVYSPKVDSLCGYQHKSADKSEEFLVAGTMVDGSVYINLCSFVVPWATLTLGQKRGFMQVYAKNCDCQVKECYGLPCQVENDLQCLWTDPLMRKRSLYASHQSATSACVNKGESMCLWNSLKSRIYATPANTASNTSSNATTK